MNENNKNFDEYVEKIVEEYSTELEENSEDFFETMLDYFI